jgi:hypothetical protein
MLGTGAKSPAQCRVWHGAIDVLDMAALRLTLARFLSHSSARSRHDHSMMRKNYASSSSGSNFGWNQICAMRVGTTALPITAVSRMVY